jgi:hypothetical protein
MRDEFFIPDGYEHLAAACERFRRDHPDYARNVFVMTRFVPGNRLLATLDEELRRALARQRLNALRADDRMYPTDRQLWDNVCVYMLGCKYGIAVLEDRVKDEFNPNVALEYGFMRALDKPVLLLTDTGFRNLRADVLGTLRAEFDIAAPDLAAELAGPVRAWVRDLGQEVRAAPGEHGEMALKLYRRLLSIRCADLLADDARRERERNDEYWYLGEEVTAARALLQRRPHAAFQAALDLTFERLVLAHDATAIESLLDAWEAIAQRP